MRKLIQPWPRSTYPTSPVRATSGWPKSERVTTSHPHLQQKLRPPFRSGNKRSVINCVNRLKQTSCTAAIDRLALFGARRRRADSAPPIEKVPESPVQKKVVDQVEIDSSPMHPCIPTMNQIIAAVGREQKLLAWWRVATSMWTRRCSSKSDHQREYHAGGWQVQRFPREPDF